VEESGISWGTLIFIALICGGISAVVWQRRGGAPRDGFWYGFILGPIGILIVALRTPSAELQVNACPYCRERVHPEASVCPHCRHDITPHQPVQEERFEGFATLREERAAKKHKAV
jgi:hypothetical protein